MVLLNFDRDLWGQMQREFQPSSERFKALPLGEQLRLLKPYMDAQEARDQARLSVYTQPFAQNKVVNG